MMRLQPECRPCLEKLVDLTVGLATTDPGTQGEARRRALDIIARKFCPEAIPAVIANLFHRAIMDLTGNPDPFRPRKDAETHLMQRLFAAVAPDDPGDELPALLELAVAGNALDFFRPAADITRDLRDRVHLTGDVAVLLSRLAAAPGRLLFLADNAGEQFFDRPLMAALRRRGWQALYVVKGGPIQNDLTRADLAASGLLTDLEPVVDTGVATVGLILEETSVLFQSLWAAADVIVAKGMGHFETLSRVRDPRLFFLLQAKCRPVAAALSVPRGAFVLRSAAK